MELFKIKRDIPFMSYGKLTTFISLVTFIAAVFFLVTKGLNFSVEFTGGTVMEVQYQQGVDVNKTRERLDTLKMGDVQVQALGTNKHIMIRLPNKEGVTSGLSFFSKSITWLDSWADVTPSLFGRRIMMCLFVPNA